jgi:hypothetical protein
VNALLYCFRHKSCETAVATLREHGGQAIAAFDRDLLRELVQVVRFDLAFVHGEHSTADDISAFNELVVGKVPSACFAYTRNYARGNRCDVLLVSDDPFKICVGTALKALMSRRRVLLVDSDESYRVTLAELLRRHNWIVFEAGDLSTATSIIQRQRFDAALVESDGVLASGIDQVAERLQQGWVKGLNRLLLRQTHRPVGDADQLGEVYFKFHVKELVACLDAFRSGLSRAE